MTVVLIVFKSESVVLITPSLQKYDYNCFDLIITSHLEWEAMKIVLQLWLAYLLWFSSKYALKLILEIVLFWFYENLSVNFL